MLKDCLENVRKKKPLIHNITNYVTVNDVAKALLAIGASPIMADDVDEVAKSQVFVMASISILVRSTSIL